MPYDLPEGKEENRVLPWVFHEANDTKLMQIRCMMRGFNAILPEQIRGVGTFVSRKICARSNITLAVKSFYPQPIPAALNHCTYIEGV